MRRMVTRTRDSARSRTTAGGTVKGKISRREDRVWLELDLREWSHLKSVLVFARKAANGPLFATDVESPAIEQLARTLLDEIGFERIDESSQR
jgi:hypothetical protein